MTIQTSSPRRKRRRLILVLAGVVALGILLAAGGFLFAASQETHDPFCGSCHTQPESTFLQRSTDTQAVDLASYHTTQKTRCIDCHSGPGILGRMRAELLGAHNALAWYTHTAVQPAKLTVPIRDANCLKCHQAVTQRGYTPKQSVTIGGGFGRGEEEARTNHWHEFLARWQAATPSAGTCTSCHPGHSTDGTAQTGFENTQTTQSVCEGCHRVLREREGG
jgi:predicted CXXCH cytochrome family protein